MSNPQISPINKSTLQSDIRKLSQLQSELGSLLVYLSSDALASKPEAERALILGSRLFLQVNCWNKYFKTTYEANI